MFPHMLGGHRLQRNVGCLGGLLRLILVIIGVKYIMDHTKSNQPVQVWPPEKKSQPAQGPIVIDQTTPATPAPGRETKKLDEGAVDPWVDKV